MSATLRNNILLLTAPATPAMFNAEILADLAEAEVVLDHRYLTRIDEIDPRIWDMLPKSLMAVLEEGYLLKLNDLLFGAIPEEVRDEDQSRALTEYEKRMQQEFFNAKVQTLARDATRYIIGDDASIDDENGEDARGEVNVPLIVAPFEVSQRGGFIPTIRALREAQAEYGLPPVKVWVFGGGSGLRRFEETPLNTPAA